jgi:hypothetical protein
MLNYACIVHTHMQYKQHTMTVVTKNFHSTAGFILAKLSFTIVGWQITGAIHNTIFIPIEKI